MIDYETLTRDALFERRTESVGSFFSNLAGTELENSDAGALTAIENVVLQEVNDKLPSDLAMQYNSFPGILSVMRCYFVIAEKSWRLDDACFFLSRLSGATRVQALDALHRLIYWEKPLPLEIKTTLIEIDADNITTDETRLIAAMLDRDKMLRTTQ